LFRPQQRGRCEEARRADETISKLLVLLICISSLTGCQNYDWRKKFVREKKHETAPAQFDLSRQYKSYEELYKSHYFYWKAWSKQLAQTLGTNPKQDRQGFKETRRQLETLQKYLMPMKADLVKKYVKELDDISAPLNRPRIAGHEYGWIRIKLRKLQGKVSKNLHIKQVKHYLKPTPPPIDLSDYEAEEPFQFELKEVPQAVDKSIDESGTITYEKYRAFPTQ